MSAGSDTPLPSVSVVIPAFNPQPWLLDAIASARNESLAPREIIVVDDGTTAAAATEVLSRAEPLVSRLIHQENSGPGAARNAGIRAATSEFIAPLDCDDLFEPHFLRDCVNALRACPEAAFAYTDYRVFGDRRFVQRAPEYNLYELLEANPLPYACVMRRDAWQKSGGYQSDRRPGYEDWDFWLRLGANGLFGHRVPRVLFRYRRHGGSQFERATERHAEVLSALREAHPQLYSDDGRAKIKAVWKPAACIISAQPPATQTIRDVRVVATVEDAAESQAGAFVVPGSNQIDPSTAERAAIAVWGGRDGLPLPDGSVAVSLPALLRQKEDPSENAPKSDKRSRAGRLETIHRHLANAELDSPAVWVRHPVRSATRAIPLRVKESVNRAAGRPLFDLSFYLKFQPRSVLLSGAPVDPLEYIPRKRTRNRIAFLTPHLGRGGAESVLLDIAAACDRSQTEPFAIATHGGDDCWADRWRAVAESTYDLASLVVPERIPGAIYSIAKNWNYDCLVLQNTLYGYSVLAALKDACPAMRVIDVVHASAGDAWDIVAATAQAAPFIDTRVAISTAVRDRLLAAGTPGNRVRLIRNGIDLDHFVPPPARATAKTRVLFAGRLDQAKRPALLADIASALKPKLTDFTFVVAGAGPEEPALRRRTRELGVDSSFELLGPVDDMARTMADCDMLILPSAVEGVPLAALEAMACARPVLASDVGAVREAVDERTGVLIPRDEAEIRAFADAIARLAASPERRAALGAAGRKRVELEYDARNARAAYAELMASARPLRLPQRP